MSRKTGLGRGLSALIPDNQQNEENQPTSRIQTDQQGTPDSNILEIATDDIKPNPNQPRTHFNEQDIEQLARSIKEHGILQPLLVSDKENGTYQLIAGERRWRAAKIANLEKVPALVRETNPQEILELALIENIQRADLSALEEAAAYQKLANDFQLTQQEIADRVGKSRTTITNTLRLLELPDKIQKSLDNNEITEGHARALLGLSNAEDMIQNLEVILSRNLNVRQTENIVKNQRLSNESHTELENTPIKSDDNKLEINLPDSRHISVTLQRLFGTKVTVQRANDGSGTLTIHFYSEEEYEGILSRLIEEENHDNY
ncbi:MAG: ParB/RepB/Spo0J family partition protein [Dehalococcoidia bacterium]|jgi:ParB family chromosome partitioning protein|nr:ParB/RepB/Spo0J family partition protein [Dehalococcoidia bacterium]